MHLIAVTETDGDDFMLLVHLDRANAFDGDVNLVNGLRVKRDCPEAGTADQAGAVFQIEHHLPAGFGSVSGKDRSRQNCANRSADNYQGINPKHLATSPR